MCQKNEEKKIKIFLIIKFINSNPIRVQIFFQIHSNLVYHFHKFILLSAEQLGEPST